jgi:hypothetical protein
MTASARITNRKGDEIRDLEAWEALAGPASYKHWKPLRSAYELARAWIEGGGPVVVGDALSGCAGLDGFVAQRAVAEAQTRFDAFGGPRNHDLLVVGETTAGRLVVAVEGKADEPFGETLREYADAAAARRTRGEGTNAPERLAGLLTAIVGDGLEARPQLANLRYQLFSATAGTLAAAAAEGSDRAVLFVHEFKTPLTRRAKRNANHEDLARFLGEVFDATPPDRESWCVGPFQVPGSDRIPHAVRLHVAKAVTSVDAGDDN